MTWTTPFRPLGDDEIWNVGCSEWSGTYEFICGQKVAQEWLNGGMTRVNGKPTRVEVVCQWPHINGVHLRITTPAEQRYEERPIP